MTSTTNLDTAHVPQDPVRRYFNSIASFARPANTTAYTAGDQITDNASAARTLQFPDCAARKGGAGALFSAFLMHDANEATPPDLELYLFDEEPTAANDNDALALTDADMENLVGIFVFTGSNAKVLNAGLDPAGALAYPASIVGGQRMIYVCESTSPDLYGVLLTRTNFTPASAGKFLIRLGGEWQ